MKRAVLVALLAACGARAQPSAPTRTEVDKAEAAEKARDHSAARAHYQAAITQAKDPASEAFARREFADTLISWGEYREAITQLETVTRVRPSDASAWHDLGLLYHNAGDDPRAISALRSARDAAPDDARPRIALAGLYWKRGDRAAARSEYEALLALDLPERVRGKVQWAIRELTP